MAGPTLWYLNGLKKALDATLALGTPKAMFVTAAYVLDQDAHNFIDDVSTNEATGTGVSAGGVTLTSVTTTVDGASNTVTLDAADISSISVTACYVVVYVDTGTPSTSPVLSITDLSDGDAVDSVWTGVVWSASGIAGISAA
jgi:hypothetical protein